MTLTVLLYDPGKSQVEDSTSLSSSRNWHSCTIFWTMIPRHFGGTTAASSNMIDLLGGFALATKYLETHSMPHHVLQDDNNRSPYSTNADKKWKGGICLRDHTGVDNCLCVTVGPRGKPNPHLSSFNSEEAVLFLSLLFNHQLFWTI